ncbi:hypothetical protein LZ30DRAFT_727980 [Colletotrichum cereale]|nr:hypothetical protein LZ30DRAFT_727980 [Colletotrichum cereale]
MSVSGRPQNKLGSLYQAFGCPMKLLLSLSFYPYYARFQLGPQFGSNTPDITYTLNVRPGFLLLVSILMASGHMIIPSMFRRSSFYPTFSQHRRHRQVSTSIRCDSCCSPGRVRNIHHP